MSRVIHVPGAEGMSANYDSEHAFKLDIQKGLSQSQKHIPSKYFYDEKGSALFNEITRHPDYYLTRCELAILDQHKNKIAAFMPDEPFNLIELGPGEGIKTQILLKQFLSEDKSFRYLPIDISPSYLELIEVQFKRDMPNLRTYPIHADFFQGLEWLSEHSDRKNLVLFLGSSIGNFDLKATYQFLSHLHAVLRAGDYVLFGFDLKKEISILLKAYDDDAGITRDFNLNLLHRINDTLDADFDLNSFSHYATYNVYTGAMESYLMSLKAQEVSIGKLNASYTFHEIEPIHVEYSHKYTLPQLNKMASETGFGVIEHYLDERGYFANSLWQVEK